MREQQDNISDDLALCQIEEGSASLVAAVRNSRQLCHLQNSARWQPMEADSKHLNEYAENEGPKVTQEFNELFHESTLEPVPVLCHGARAVLVASTTTPALKDVANEMGRQALHAGGKGSLQGVLDRGWAQLNAATLQGNCHVEEKTRPP